MKYISKVSSNLQSITLILKDFSLSFILKIKERNNYYAAYLSTLYYLEIIYLMFSLLFVFGKTLSLIIGFILSILLTIHIFLIYYKKNLNRKIQLFIMDFHIAYAIAYIFNISMLHYEMNFINIFVLSTRSILLIFELPLLYILTDDDVMRGFQ